MFILDLLTLAFIILLVVFVMTQIIAPIATSRPLLPLFRKSRNVVEGEVVELQEQLRERELEKVRDDLRHKLEE